MDRSLKNNKRRKRNDNKHYIKEKFNFRFAKYIHLYLKTAGLSVKGRMGNQGMK